MVYPVDVSSQVDRQLPTLGSLGSQSTVGAREATGLLVESIRIDYCHKNMTRQKSISMSFWGGVSHGIRKALILVTIHVHIKSLQAVKRMMAVNAAKGSTRNNMKCWKSEKFSTVRHYYRNHGDVNQIVSPRVHGVTI